MITNGHTQVSIQQVWINRDDYETSDALRDLADHLDDLGHSSRVIGLTFDLSDDEGLTLGAFLEFPEVLFPKVLVSADE